MFKEYDARSHKHKPPNTGAEEDKIRKNVFLRKWKVNKLNKKRENEEKCRLPYVNRASTGSMNGQFKELLQRELSAGPA